MEIIERAPAKINLGLDVLHKRVMAIMKLNLFLQV